MNRSAYIGLKGSKQESGVKWQQVKLTNYVYL